MEPFPANSHKVKEGPKAPKTDEKDIKPLEGVKAVKRKPSLGKQFRKTFIGGDAKEAAQYAILMVAVPALKDTIADAGSQALERLIFGESRGPRRRPSGSPIGGPSGFINYANSYRAGGGRPAATAADQRQTMSRRARAQHDFEEIILPDRAQANDVIEQLFAILDRYESTSVADLYTTVGLDYTHIDQQWGWTDLRGAVATRVRNGFLIDLPDPEPLA